MRSVLLVLTLSTDFNVETRCVLLRALIGQNCSSTATQEMLFCVKTFLAGGATTLLRVELPVDFHAVCAAYFLCTMQQGSHTTARLEVCCLRQCVNASHKNDH